MDRQQITQIVNENPQLQQAVDVAEAQVAQMNINPELIDEIVQVLEHILDNPDHYPAIREAAIRDGFIEPDDLPEQFDPQVIIPMLVVFYGLLDRTTRKFARGGHVTGMGGLAALGRGGDTMLAHINPQEAMMLKMMGGSGTVNPNTGLTEFKGGSLNPAKIVKSVGKAVSSAVKSVGSIAKTVAPIALAVYAPQLGMMNSAMLGAAMGAAGGGGLKGAVMGGLGGALGAGAAGSLGGYANEALGAGLSAGAQNVLGSTLIGGGLGALSGQGAAKGAVGGALGGVAGNAISGMAGVANTPVNAGITTGGQTVGNLMTMGATPQQALKGGALAGLASGLIQNYNTKPSEAVNSKLGMKGTISEQGLTNDSVTLNQDSVTGGGLDKYSLSNTATAPDVKVDYSLNPEAKMSPLEMAAKDATGDLYKPTPSMASQVGKAVAETGIGLNKSTLTGGLALAGLLGAQGAPEAPPEAVEAITAMSPEQQEYFNRPSYVWDWDKMKSDATAKGQDLGTYMANNWNLVSGGAYNKELSAGTTTGAQNYAEGGAVVSALRKLNSINVMPTPIEPAPQQAAFNPVSSLGKKFSTNSETVQQPAADPFQSLEFGPSVLKGLRRLNPEPVQAAPAVVANSTEVDNPNGTKPVAWDWTKIQAAAKAAKQDLGTFIATNWGDISGGMYSPVKLAHGGALNALAQGGGSGRADTIHAKLSDGEYVIDAETVALLGDGSTKEGAKRLDEMRKKLRMQKGKTLAKGNFSPAAKSPLAYLKGAA